MFGRKKEKKESGTWTNLSELTKSIFKKRDLKIEKREITK